MVFCALLFCVGSERSGGCPGEGEERCAVGGPWLRTPALLSPCFFFFWATVFTSIKWGCCVYAAGLL